MARSHPAFPAAHAREIVAGDFLLAPTLTFRLPFVFVVLRHELVHLNVTDHLTAPWTVRQIIEAFPEDSGPNFLLRDLDAIYTVPAAQSPTRHRQPVTVTPHEHRGSVQILVESPNYNGSDSPHGGARGSFPPSLVEWARRLISSALVMLQPRPS